MVRLYGLRNWVEQSYKQVKHELGWADFMVRSDRAIRRHWHLVCCAFSFCWRVWFTQGGEPTVAAEPLPPLDQASGTPPSCNTPGADPAPGRGGIGQVAPGSVARPVSWPTTLRRVRGWLAPWTFLWLCWRAWSSAPPPPELQALLDSVGHGRPLNLYLRC